MTPFFVLLLKKKICKSFENTKLQILNINICDNYKDSIVVNQGCVIMIPDIPRKGKFQNKRIANKIPEFQSNGDSAKKVKAMIYMAILGYFCAPNFQEASNEDKVLIWTNFKIDVKENLL